MDQRLYELRSSTEVQRVLDALKDVKAAASRYWKTRPRGFGQLQDHIHAAKSAGARCDEIVFVLRLCPLEDEEC